MTTKLTIFCPIFLPITSVQSEIVTRLILEIKNDTMRNKHVLVYKSGKKLTSVQQHKNKSSRGLSFKDAMKSTFHIAFERNYHSERWYGN